MLTVLVNWIYVFITCMVIGRFVLKRAAKFVKYDKEASIMANLLMGFAMVTAYAGYFSIFHRVSILANVIMLICCIVILVLERKDYIRLIRSMVSGLSKLAILRLLQFAFGVFVILGTLFLTSYGIFHHDTGLYHAQSIRWIEEYGIIKGLSLVQNRFAYNSSFFCVSALYSFAFLGQSLHTLNGLMAVLAMLYGFVLISNNIVIYKKVLSYTNILSLAPFIYTVAAGLELISPTTDPVLVYLVFIIVISWARLLDRNEKEIAPFAFLCVMTAFLISIKLSVGVIVLFVIKPAIMLIKEKRVKDIIFYIVSAIILVAPYFIRNVIISSWLIYPFTAIDLFHFPWRIPAADAQHDANEITTWARYVRDAELIDQSVFEWAPVWWQGQTATDHWYSFAAIAGFVITVVNTIVAVVSAMIAKLKYSANYSANKNVAAGSVHKNTANSRTDKNEKYINDDRRESNINADEGVEWDYVFLDIMIVLGTLFWFFSAPLVRYGYLYLIMLPLVAICSVLRIGRICIVKMENENEKSVDCLDKTEDDKAETDKIEIDKAEIDKIKIDKTEIDKTENNKAKINSERNNTLYIVKKIVAAFVAIGLAIFLTTPTLRLALEDRAYVNANWSRAYAIHQKDYPVAETSVREYPELDNVSFYYPNEPGTPVWYEAFPSVLYEENIDGIVPLGDSIEDGFAMKNPRM